MIQLDKQQVAQKAKELDGIGFVQWVTDAYLAAVGGALTAETMDRLTAEQHGLLCYRYVLDEVMEGGFIQLILNGYAPYVLEGPFPYVVKKEWAALVPDGAQAMKDFSKLLYAVKAEYHRHEEELSQELSDEDFMALYEQLEELNEMGDNFLDEHQEVVTPLVVKMVVENVEKFL